MELFVDTVVPAGLDDVWVGARLCPACDGGTLRPAFGAGLSHWRCETCGECWRIEHGLLRRVDPVGCEGCSARAKSECVARVSLGRLLAATRRAEDDGTA